MIREDRELLTELARLNRALAPLAPRILDGSASVSEQQAYAGRLMATGERLQRRAVGTEQTVIKGEVLTNGTLALPVRTFEPREA